MTTYQFHEVVVPADGALSFAFRDENSRPWWWYLDLDGIPLYLISNACGTCEAIFRRVQDLEAPIAPQELSGLLRQGLQAVSDDIVQTVVPLLPQGRYVAGLIDIPPSRLTSAQRPRFVGCQSDYFWWRPFREHASERVYELILPFVPEANLSGERIAQYRALLQQGHRPTALALSIVDERAVAGQFTERALVHFLLDGHHKVMAASQTGYPIRVLSFLRETALAGIPHIDPKARAYYSGSSFE